LVVTSSAPPTPYPSSLALHDALPILSVLTCAFQDRQRQSAGLLEVRLCRGKGGPGPEHFGLGSVQDLLDRVVGPQRERGAFEPFLCGQETCPFSVFAGGEADRGRVVRNPAFHGPPGCRQHLFRVVPGV